MGAIDRATRFAVLHDAGYRCHYCGRAAPSVELEVDHVFPLSRGGSNCISNLVASCFDCNRGKRDKIVTIHLGGNSDALAIECAMSFMRLVHAESKVLYGLAVCQALRAEVSVGGIEFVFAPCHSVLAEQVRAYRDKLENWAASRFGRPMSVTARALMVADMVEVEWA